MKETRVCLECKAPLPQGMSEFFCPACALRHALKMALEQEPGGKNSISSFAWFRRLFSLNWLRSPNRTSNRSPIIALDSPNHKEEQSSTVSRPAPEPGDVIEDYEILEKIGGNMGLVFKARHRLLHKVVALKLLPGDDAARLARFQREMRVMGQLEHPNLVSAEDARQVNSWHLVVMPWIDGVDLQQLVRMLGPIPIPIAIACEAARQAALGLQHAHQHGLIHRDIKPSNLMLTRTGMIKVIDMGLARENGESAAQLTQEGHVMGTPAYLPPEQFNDAAHVDIRADIYSLGCTLYHLLAGKAPYPERKTFPDLMHAHLHEPFPRLGDVRPDAPAELEAVLARMTAKDLDARFKEPIEVAAALEPFSQGAVLKGIAPEARPEVPVRRASTGKVTPLPERQPGQSGQGPRWLRATALVILLLAVASVAFLVGREHRPSVPTAPSAQPLASRVAPVPAPEAIVLMDTTADGGIYDEKNRGKGITNAEELSNVLDLIIPRRLIHKEALFEDWKDEERVLATRPRLVIIHRSSFFHSYNATYRFGAKDGFKKPSEDPRWKMLYKIADERLMSLLAYVGERQKETEFLVYSRGTDENWLEPKFRDEWTEKIEERFPHLKGRLFTMEVPGRQAGTFRDPATGELVRDLVTEILGLDY